MQNTRCDLNLSLGSVEQKSSAPHTTQTSQTGSPKGQPGKKAVSSWTAKHAGAKADTKFDFLSNLGEAQNYNINVDHGEYFALHATAAMFRIQGACVLPSCCHCCSTTRDDATYSRFYIVEKCFAGQNISMIDHLFVGDILGKKSDIADGSLRDYEFSKFDHIVGDYYIAPRFLDNIALSFCCPLHPYRHLHAFAFQAFCVNQKCEVS